MKNHRSCWLFTTILGIVLLTFIPMAESGLPAANGPTFLSDPINPINENREIILQKGQNFSITCKGKNPLEIQQQKRREEVVGPFFMQLMDVIDTYDEVNPYETTLNLYNVDHYAVGYYACFDDSANVTKLLDIMEEPTDTDHITYVYVYVNDDGPDPQLFAPMSEFAIKINRTHFVLQCKPTMPDVNVTINVLQNNETPEIIKVSPKVGVLVRPCRNSDQCSYECKGTRGSRTSWKSVQIRYEDEGACDVITIYRQSEYFMEGDNFTLNCSIPYQNNAAVDLNWLTPWENPQASYDHNEKSIGYGQRLYKAITISNATKKDEGKYTCTCKQGYIKYKTKSDVKRYLDESFINLNQPVSKLVIKKTSNFAEFKVEVEAYPKPTFAFFRNGQPLVVHKTDIKNCNSPGAVKYREENFKLTNDAKLTICNFTLSDIANYTVSIRNRYKEKNVTFDIRKEAPPKVELLPVGNVVHQELNQKRSLQCFATGYPLPMIQWIYVTDDGQVQEIKGNETTLSVYKVLSSLLIGPSDSGNLTCKATVKSDTVETVKRVLVHEIPRGFGILEKRTWYPEGFSVSLKCLATIYEYQELSWRGPNGDELLNEVNHYDTKLSHVAILQLAGISIGDAGSYTCVGKKFNGSEEHESITITVEALRTPNIIEPVTDRDELVEKFQSVNFSCVADAVPSPHIEWFKDGVKLQNNTDGVNIYYYLNHTVVNSTIFIGKMQIENEGKYVCSANNENMTSEKFINLKVPQVLPHKTAIIGGVVSVMLALIALVFYLMWKVRKERRFRKELADAGLLNFKEGVTKSLNPDLGIDEQAELLPYDEKFEFPSEKLIFGKQLGAGAFGVVYKAEARGIINAEETTPVAVKMVKKTADNMYIKALASELKIMVHLGKHINIVNLLGACTKNVGKRELIVIVEYCKFGNIHNYMQKHREVFIDQLTDSKEKNLGRVNRGYSCSSGSSGMNSDYFGTHSQATDHTLLNSSNTHRSERKDKRNQPEEFVKVSETGYVQPEWRSNYECDYSYEGRNPRPLYSRDLLAWAFQIARGMEYLASRKILHGDLAARNVLLAEDNIVKICDFGLAKSIYKNDEYQKKENSPLPVKWLAIECMMDRIFTTQSDVWAFGIVLWEMFSLAKTPYPNMSPQHLLQWLSDGHRLEKPPYADDRLYDVMMRCWEHKPNARPSFSHLQELLGSFLEDNVRNHYVDLNSAFMDMNVKCVGEDYLAMVSAPDYNNLVTPSPHHYVNEVRSFFPPTPTQVPLDEEGYLQMTPVNPSIFSPRSASTKFDFDAKKLESRVAESRCGTELTPMLTLNNLPARSGSDSDHEGGLSPYLKMCPRIAEETDDVFKVNEINEKNIQNSAVTNPTYISLDLDIDKKPQDINNYINIPNGLVK